MEVTRPILTAFDHSKEHHLGPYGGKGETSQNPTKNLPLKFRFTLVQWKKEPYYLP